MSPISHPDLRTIVAGYLPTPEGNAALEAAQKWALSSGATLIVVNTGREGDYSHPSFATARDIDAIDAELAQAGIPHEVRQPTDGKSAAESILGAAATSRADLIVIGMRRRSPVGKLIAGSTAQHILLDAPCAVLSVKPAS